MKFVSIYFFVAIFVGFLFVYITKLEPKIVIKNPNPDNIDDITYIDDNKVCYKYKKEKVKCPLDQTKNLIKY